MAVAPFSVVSPALYAAVASFATGAISAPFSQSAIPNGWWGVLPFGRQQSGRTCMSLKSHDYLRIFDFDIARQTLAG